MLTCVEICAGAGGQALGLAMAGFVHVALVEYEKEYCDILKENRPEWPIICADVHDFDGKPYHGVDLFAGGVPCPPFSVAGKQLGADDERDLFPEALRLVREIEPRAIMLENVRGFLDPSFREYREYILRSIAHMGYDVQIKLLQASDYGVSQLRPPFSRYERTSSSKSSSRSSVRILLRASLWLVTYAGSPESR